MGVPVSEPAPRSLRSVFIVGAPRCGTTFLAKALAGHPAVCFSKPKETHFFVRAWPSIPRADVAREYLRRHFAHLGPEHQLIADGSPSYLYDPEVAARILDFDPEARLVVAVRNPVDMAHSYHARLLYTLDEDEPDLATAWALQEARARGERLPRRCREPLLLQYQAVCSLGEQVLRLFATAGRERCHVVVFDDLAADPVKVYRSLLEFAGLEDDGRREFSRKNENREFRHPWLQPYVMNPPWPIGPLLEVWERRGWRRPRIIRAVRRRIKKWNTRKAARPAPDPALRETLRRAFAADVERLGAAIGRDLSHWR
jgi:hypothetical protein